MEQQEGVKERVAELQIAQAESIDRAWVLVSAKGLFEDAKNDKAYTPAAHTLELIAKVIGCWNERPAPDNNHVIRVYSETPLTEEEWLRSVHSIQKNGDG